MKSRYPDMLDSNLDNKVLAEEALEFAQEIIKTVKLKLI